ncbi:hypothetical protein IAU59_000543 [Kwoniella sp. CBS 9459]
MESYDLSTSFPFPTPYSQVHVALFRDVRNSPQIRKRLVEASVATGPEGDQLRREVDYGFVEASVLVSKEQLITAILTTLLYAFPSKPSSSSSSSAPAAELVPPAMESLSITSTQGSAPIQPQSQQPESQSQSQYSQASSHSTSTPQSSTPSSSSSSSSSSPTKSRTRTHNLHSELLLSLSPNNNITDSIRRHGLSDNTRLLAVVRIGGPEESAEEVYKGIESVVDGELVSWDVFDRGALDGSGGEAGVQNDWARIDKIYKLSELNALKSSRSASDADIRHRKIAAVVSAVAIKNVI